MENNPYTPPSADITEREDPQDAAPPRSVIYAVWMLWASLALSIVELLLTAGSTSLKSGTITVDLAGTLFVVVVMALLMGAYALVVHKVRGGRNWARITILIFTALGILESLTSHHSAPLIPFMLDLVATVLNVIALALVFRPQVSPWFNRARR